jgi:hypothetical protein
MLKLLLRRSGAKNQKPTVSKPAAAGELAQGELWLNNNHETPALFARADDDTLIEWKPGGGGGGVASGNTPPASPVNGQSWINTGNTPPTLEVYDAATSSWKVALYGTPPVLASISLADVAGGSRFTSTTFPATPHFTTPGSPAATLDIKAKVIGTLTSLLESGPVVTAALKPGALSHMTWSAVPGADGHGATRQTQMSLTGKFDYISPVPPGAYTINEFGVRTSGDVSPSGPTNVDFTITFNPPLTGTLFSTGVGTWKDGDFGGKVIHRVYLNGTEIIINAANITAAVTTGLPIPGGSLSTVRFHFSTGGENLQWIWGKQMKLDGQPLAANGATLTFASAADLTGFAVGDHVVNSADPTSKGNITDITGNTVTLAPQLGPAFAVGNKMTLTKAVANTTKYLQLTPTGAVTGLLSADPGYTHTAFSSAASLIFPATLPSGAAPDTDLPAGTTLTIEAKGVNAAGSSAAVTSTITPA